MYKILHVNTLLIKIFFSNFIADGGKLQEELDFVETKLGKGAGATNELIIQIPLDEEKGSVLNSEALLTHLEVLKTAARIVVEDEDR